MKKIVKIKRALISLSDKSDLKKILDNLSKYKIKLISSGGTYKKIKKLGFNCTELSDYTGFNEMLDGRVKTLHPKIHAGILSVRKNKKHRKELKFNKFEEIDLILVNFYPFEKAINQTNNFTKIIENIDIGGPTLVRAAAKNFKDVAVITSSKLYEKLFYELKKNKGCTSLDFRKNVAVHAFNEVSYYDSVISNYLSNKTSLLLPHKKTFHGKLNEKLRYGENPHQIGGYYSSSYKKNIKQLHGKKLSFNNYNDIFSALSISETFKKNIGTTIIKHTNPCGVSCNKNSIKSFSQAFNCDPISAFGGIVSCNYKIKKELALLLKNKFFEIIIGKGFGTDAIKILKQKKNLRLIDSTKFDIFNKHSLIFFKDQFLLQNQDDVKIIKKNLKIVSNKKPTKDQFESLIFAFNACKYVKSNAIVLAKKNYTIGIGSGQPSRLDSCKIAIEKAKKFLPDKLYKSVAASDAFFPFTDGIEQLIQSGVEAIIQPGGSIKDKDIIKFANKTDTVLIFSKTRHFKH